MTPHHSAMRSFLASVALTVGAPLFASGLVCARTPELAVKLAHATKIDPMPLQDNGYRVEAIRQDPVLKQRWAIVASCGHPERPSVAVRISEPSTPAVPDYPHEGNRTVEHPFPVIHAGDLVQTWKQEENLRIEMAGRAEENGTIGSYVRVRLLHSGFDTAQEQTITGIVRGPGDVEMAQ